MQQINFTGNFIKLNDSYDNEDTCTSNDGQWNAESSVSLLVENENQLLSVF